MMAAHVPSRLYRSRSEKMIAGVSGGLGEYFDVDPVLIRLLFVVTSFISGAGILAYIILWIVVPREDDAAVRMEDRLRRDFDDISGRVREHIEPWSVPWGGPARSPGASAPADVRAATASATEAHEPEVDPAADTASSPAGERPDTDSTDDPQPRSAASEPEATRPPEADSAPDVTPGPETAWRYQSQPADFGAPVAPPVDRRRRRQHWAGAILIVIGLLVLGNNLGLLWWARAQYVVPLILVVAGAWLLFGRGRRG